MNWRLAGVIAVTELRRRARDRSLFFTGLVGPFALALIISLAFGGGTTQLRIGVQDLDGSAVSRGLVDGFVKGANGEGDGADASGLDVVVVDSGADAADVAISDDGPASVIVVPKGFGDSLGAQQPMALRVVTDDGDAFTSEIATAIAESLAAEVDRTRLLVLAGSVARAAAPSNADPSTDELVAAAAAVPPAIVPTQDEAGDAYSAASYFAPAMTMFFLFLSLGMAASGLIADRRIGVLARMRATPTSDTTIVIGRAAGVVGLGLMSTITLWAVSGPIMGADWGPPLPALIVIVCVVLAITGLSMLVMAFARTESQASGSASILGFGMALLGGTFFPTAVLPGALRSVALFTPNGLAQRGFTELSLGTTALADIWWVPIGLLSMAAVTGGVALVVIRQRVLA